MPILSKQLASSVCYNELMDEFFPLERKKSPVRKNVRLPNKPRNSEKSSTLIVSNETNERKMNMLPMISSVPMLKRMATLPTPSKSFFAANNVDSVESLDVQSPEQKSLRLIEEEINLKSGSERKMGSIEDFLGNEGKLATVAKRRQPVIKMSLEQSNLLKRRAEFANNAYL
jgi:hypothetical protein